jgi:site-specific DNA recombinase
MAEIKIISKEKQIPKLVRVAAYARVSSDKDAMLHSLSSQVSYFSKMIQSHDSWKYVGVYSDEGMTGTKIKRDGFQRMIQDAKAGKIDIIVTKSLSRFARNTVDCLKTIREMKAINVDIFFEEQNIHTLSANGEFLISLLAGYAQEESRQCSENTLWRVRKNFKEGKPYGGSSLLGYKLEKGRFTVVPEEAEIVRKIFDLYLAGNGFCKIARILTNEGIKSYTGKAWNKSTLGEIISNVTYTGNLHLQKTYRENHMTKKTMRNKGEKPLYIVEGNHEPIISQEIFDKAQEIRKAKAVGKSGKRNGPAYPFTGLIYCGECGHLFKHKVTKYYESWCCSQYDELGKAYCASKKIRDDVLRKACAEALDIDSFDETTFKKNIRRIDAFNGNRLVFHFINGITKEVIWDNPSRRDSWTDEMKLKAKERSSKNGKR